MQRLAKTWASFSSLVQNIHLDIRWVNCQGLCLLNIVHDGVNLHVLLICAAVWMQKILKKKFAFAFAVTKVFLPDVWWDHCRKMPTHILIVDMCGCYDSGYDISNNVVQYRRCFLRLILPWRLFPQLLHLRNWFQRACLQFLNAFPEYNSLLEIKNVLNSL